MPLPNFLKLFTGAKMSSLEFEKLKNKINVAKATIVHQTLEITKKDAKIADLQAEIKGLRLAEPAVSVGDADYAELSKGLDEVFAETPCLRPIEEPVADATAFAPATTPAEPAPTPVAATIPTDVSYPGTDHPRNEA